MWTFFALINSENYLANELFMVMGAGDTCSHHREQFL